MGAIALAELRLAPDQIDDLQYVDYHKVRFAGPCVA